jgi:DNA recombination-dependent growth factor C
MLGLRSRLLPRAFLRNLALHLQFINSLRWIEVVADSTAAVTPDGRSKPRPYEDAGNYGYSVD